MAQDRDRVTRGKRIARGKRKGPRRASGAVPRPDIPVNLLTPELRSALCANATTHVATQNTDEAEPDPVPILKLFNPLGAGMWLATELAPDDDTLFGLADLGFGCPELGYFSLREIGAVRLPFGLSIERDVDFASTVPLSRWAETARRASSIIAAELALAPIPELPPGPSDG